MAFVGVASQSSPENPPASPGELAAALAEVRGLLLADGLVRAVASGRRRDGVPSAVKAELRPVDLKAGRRLQVVTTDGRTPTTRNLEPGEHASAEVDRLLAEPFGSWYVETLEQVLQLRVTKKGRAQVHVAATSRRDVAVTSHDRARRHLLAPDDPLFTVLGADADKRRQVDAFLRLLAPLAQRVGAAAAEQGRPLHVVDLGCGNAYLTTAAHRWLADPERGHGPVRTVGVDVRPEMAARNADVATRLGLTGLEFVAGTIADAEIRLDPVDLVLALHACDTATDEALAAAVTARAPAILVAPCCHHDLQRQLGEASAADPAGAVPHPWAPLVRQPILRERFADVLTDALRADLLRLHGYRVDVVEFVDSRHTPRNLMLRAVRTGAPATPRRRAEYRDLVSAWRVVPALERMIGTGE